MEQRRLLDVRKSRIVDVIKVGLEGILLELHFNIAGPQGDASFVLGIDGDAERILFDWRSGHTGLNGIGYDEGYSTTLIDKSSMDRDLARLVGDQIEDALFGIVPAANGHDRALYYFRMFTDKNEFLFFNNADEGGYAFDGIDELLSQDIYGVTWDHNPVLVRFSA